jgi:acyl-CoA oxidase
MFYSSVVNLAAPEQVAEWLPKIRSMQMTGAYAQTELGHGSFVPGLETTATFDREKQEFVINTPTISASKFWPGDLGHFSNHAIVFAKLIVDGKAMGVHPFMVQTRDLQTWKPLPGIECGDIGPKFGYQTKDNGYMIFRGVRIPRTNMLRRFVELDEQGQLQIKGDLRVIYGIMLETRVWIANNTPLTLAAALTIGTRYAVVRRQFPTLDKAAEGEKPLERKLLDY